MISSTPVEDLDTGTAGAASRRSRGGIIRRVTGDVRAAVALLTRLPVGLQPDASTGARSFPIVGAIVGGAGAIPLVAIGDALPALAGGIALAVMAIVTGAIHLDGLADTADALVAVGPGAAERARRDPAVGVGGIVALILVLVIEYATFGILLARSGSLAAASACLVAGATSRFAPILLVFVGSAETGSAGLGAWFRAGTSRLDAVVSAIAAAAIALAVAGLLERSWPLVAVLGGLVVGNGAGLALRHLRGQVDGDLLGATVEITFLATLIGAAAWAVPVGA